MIHDDDDAIQSDKRHAKRLRTIDAINRKLAPPSPENLKALQEHDCETWGEYIANCADNAGMSLTTAFQLFDMLGESEAFDGFVTSMEDAESAEE